MAGRRGGLVPTDLGMAAQLVGDLVPHTVQISSVSLSIQICSVPECREQEAAQRAQAGKAGTLGAPVWGSVFREQR